MGTSDDDELAVAQGDAHSLQRADGLAQRPFDVAQAQERQPYGGHAHQADEDAHGHWSGGLEQGGGDQGADQYARDAKEVLPITQAHAGAGVGGHLG